MESGKEEQSFNEVSDEKLKVLFKDKKIQKLWMKAEQAGLTEIELKLLKEEFTHHQDKVDQFYSILDAKEYRQNQTDIDNNLPFQDFENIDDTLGTAEAVRGKHRSLKDSYDRLHRMVLDGPKHKDFSEPRVQTLWRTALKAGFPSEELESLQVELRHYEQRLGKLNHLQAIHAEGMKHDLEDLPGKIKLQERKVEKLHAELESRIMQRRLEL
uniref:EOG090X09CU n=1 Tax=Lynceus sp. MCZ IZ 141354 TaxID=1930659 RepID=A0A9N6WRC0_9CRUS|nr:EOG090X09CU [Lynceus sp. MCZ IZ 141354]